MGKKMDSIALANFISQTLGTKKITFIIGGAHGVAQKVKARANIAISFSDMTFPHMLVRIILLEQIYRSKSILSGHPYHK
jgi:23S rRNA (pseudouridine1915-N3)-methyltransferase